MVNGQPAGFRIVTELGSGPTGEVYFAEHGEGARAALKILRAELCADEAKLDDILLSARAIGQLGHPHIARVIETGRMEGRSFIASEMVDGESLEERFDRTARLEPREAAEIGAAIADALGAAQELGFHVHAGIKPTNVFVHRGVVKVTDFGLMRLLARVDGELATVTYASPEQCADPEHIDARSDVYSLGALLYRALLGRPPFDADEPALLVVAHANQPLEPPRSVRRDVPRWLDRIVSRALSKDPDERYTSPQAIAAALREGLAAAFGEEAPGTVQEAEPLVPVPISDDDEEFAPTSETACPPDLVERTAEMSIDDIDGPPTRRTATPVPPPTGELRLVDSQPPTTEEREARVADKLSRALVQRIVSGRLTVPAAPEGVRTYLRVMEATEADEVDASEALEADEALRGLLGDSADATLAVARIAREIGRSVEGVDGRLAYLAAIVLEAGRPLVRGALPDLEQKLKEPDTRYLGDGVRRAVMTACHREVAVSVAYGWQVPEAIPQALPRAGLIDPDQPCSLANVLTTALALAISSGQTGPHPCVHDPAATLVRGRSLLGLPDEACEAIVAIQVD